MSGANPVRRFFARIFGRSRSQNNGEELDRKTYESLESDQREMIQGVVEFGDTTAKEVMVPRIDVVFVDADASREEMLKIITESGHSRFPVYQETMDKVIGVLYSKDVLRAMVNNEDVDAKHLIRKPYFTPESKHIDDLLRELRRRKVHIAIVVDEYGGTSGIVCMEDIIEEIIGDIQDEFDNEREDITPLGEGVWLCDARANLDDLCEKLDVEPPEGDFDTLGGFVFDLFGKIPVKFEKVSFNGYDFIVQDMDGHKIETVKIVRTVQK
jgi:CBS domain containing-hemolysin-like protein